MDEARRLLVAQRIGAAIALAREKAGLSQDQVGEALDIGPQAVSRIERGVVDPPGTRLVELSELFDVSACEFLQRERAGQSLSDQAQQFDSLVWHLSADERSRALDVVAAFVDAIQPRKGRPRPFRPHKPRDAF